MSVAPLSSFSAERLPDPDGGLLWFAMLGPLEIAVAGARTPVTSIRARSLLTSLLLQRNQVVRLDRLIESIWEAPPPTALPQVRNIVAELRRTLRAAVRGREIIETSPGGYRLVVTDDEVDVARAEDYLSQGMAAVRNDNHHLALESFARSLDLWRGEPLGDVAPVLARAWRPRFAELRRRGLLGRTKSRLALGMEELVVGELFDAVAEFPFDEELRLLLVTALYNRGRTTAALEVCRETRRYFFEHLGIDAGSTLRDLEVQILRDESSG